jgi:hypothetical protein
MLYKPLGLYSEYVVPLRISAMLLEDLEALSSDFVILCQQFNVLYNLLFMSIRRDYVSELRPLTSSQMIY